jgi:hypothetical protein|tara:strand:- start:148360 stop:148743 length:384 start_codon:yes stop_codon:yes gene_type:complete
MKLPVITAIAILALAGCAASTPSADSEPQDPRLTAAATGEPINCVNLRDIDRTEPLDARNILFVMRGSRVYRNELPTSCPPSARDDAFSYRTPTGQICSGEILTFFEPANNFPTGSCALGQFTPIEE